MLHPGVRCETCREIEEVDGVAPDCAAGECLVPPAPTETVRVLDTWHLLNELREFGGGGVIMAQAGLSAFEVGLLATIERAVKDAAKAAPAPAPAEGG